MVGHDDDRGGAALLGRVLGAFTKYYEATLESDWRATNNTNLRGGSYTWSHYYGTFDQDNTTFNTAHKYGDLRGDRRHILKPIGTQVLPWNATAVSSASTAPRDAP